MQLKPFFHAGQHSARVQPVRGPNGLSKQFQLFGFGQLHGQHGLALGFAEIGEFLRDGGLRMTLVDNGQQWDAPNGWAPLQWAAVCGLKRYGLDELAEEIRRRWLASTERVSADKGKMIEKYDVDSESRIGGGGEYPLQDGFGWTNGVYAALYDRFDERCPR